VFKSNPEVANALPQCWQNSLLIILFTVVSIQVSSAQTTIAKNRLGYSQYSKAVRINAYYTRWVDKGGTSFRPTISFLFRTKRKLFHEITLTKLKSSQSFEPALFPYPGNLRNKTLEFYHQVSLNLRKHKDRRFIPQVGVCALYNIQRTKFNPIDKGYNSRTASLLHITIRFVPQVQYNINKKMFITLAMPFDFTDQIFYSQKIGSVKEGGYQSRFYFLETMNMSLGLGLGI
jgi:hypothetical protein